MSVLGVFAVFVASLSTSWIFGWPAPAESSAVAGAETPAPDPEPAADPEPQPTPQRFVVDAPESGDAVAAPAVSVPPAAPAPDATSAPAPTQSASSPDPQPILAPYRPPKPAPTWAILVEPLPVVLSPLVGQVSLPVSYHHYLAPWIGISASLGVAGRIRNFGLLPLDLGGWSVGASIGPRILFSKQRRVAGAYLLPALIGSVVRVSGTLPTFGTEGETTVVDATTAIIGGSVTGGYMWAWKNGFTLNLGGGLTVSGYLDPNTGLGSAGLIGPVSPTISFGLGYGR